MVQKLGAGQFWSVVICLGYSLAYYYKSDLLVQNLLKKQVSYQWDSLLTKMYFSVITFTTLGFGDVVASTRVGQLVVMSEVILGYLMLGALISFLANRLIIRNQETGEQHRRHTQ